LVVVVTVVDNGTAAFKDAVTAFKAEDDNETGVVQVLPPSEVMVEYPSAVTATNVPTPAISP
jgi:hypothetical protein